MDAALLAVDVQNVFHAADGDIVGFQRGIGAVSEAQECACPVLAFHLAVNHVALAATGGHAGQLTPLVVLQSQHEADGMDT